MLVLSRKTGERIQIGNAVVITVLRIRGDQVRLGIQAPVEVAVLREEVRERSPLVSTGENPNTSDRRLEGSKPMTGGSAQAGPGGGRL